jgi:hypothetical protein
MKAFSVCKKLWEAQMVNTTGANLMKNLVSLAGVLNRFSSARYFRPAALYLINKKGVYFFYT